MIHAMNQQTMRKEGILQPILADPLIIRAVGGCGSGCEGRWGGVMSGVMGGVVTIAGGSVTSHTASFGPPQSCARS